MVWKRENPQGYESRKIRWEIVPYTRGRGLDLGCGPEKCYSHMIGVDNGHHEMFGYRIQPDIRGDCATLGIFATGSLDFCFSAHLLEHFPYGAVPSILKEWMRVLKIGGHLVLYLPDEAAYPKVGEEGANPDHQWDVNYDRVICAMPDGFDLIDYQQRHGDEEYSLYFVFRKCGAGRHTSWRKTERPKKTVGVIRYGAFGDLMQASSVFAGLKRQGYHVTLFSSPPGVDVVLHDPNIDRIVLQDKDQVPNDKLGEYWTYWRDKFDRFVNLSESVEGTFLAMPGRVQHTWSPAVRHSMMNRNYLQFQHELAGIPHRPAVRFYPTDAERDWARKQRAKMGPKVLLWQLAGSSRNHKTYPHLDAVVARLLLTYPDLHVVLTGGVECQILEAGWEKEPRVYCTSGQWTIRQTLTFLEQVDAVAGTETGVLNAASCMTVPKVVFLSHSTAENLTRDWVNTVALSAAGVHCPGRGRDEAPACHQMHYGWDHCKKDEATGVSVCMAQIEPAEAFEAVKRALSLPVLSQVA